MIRFIIGYTTATIFMLVWRKYGQSYLQWQFSRGDYPKRERKHNE